MIPGKLAEFFLSQPESIHRACCNEKCCQHLQVACCPQTSPHRPRATGQHVLSPSSMQQLYLGTSCAPTKAWRQNPCSISTRAGDTASAYMGPRAPSKSHQQQHCSRRRVKAHAWTQVIDQASGKPYYWNTDTNETAWELPTSAAAPSSPQDEGTTNGSSSSSSAGTAGTEATMSHEALFDVLAAAYAADGSGMEFWEVARAHRKYGVFEPPYFDYLEQRQKAATSDADRELAFKMMCRLSNPLLRQPAPFE